mmetsp:Transcript_28972/g.43730  ORF Transcript_28972/g.43730 Transcript_28972/m.43730 type:complete len:172 (-) Transcript_28972:889-1404(-)|eukprot:CAMPEP_0170506176 /NCGR_PEP_ID=MMETSP0208-20121228/53936_1 /TAXON_ID=197538 /ORGANISM="Strombidium inclinatum, Strain S3" /LENGTH=171 /DNA_ID=CAMNT_0010787533 /DNA_START=1400 /DNA_END=1915 /DNA_ORIENTATION=+
MINTKKLTGAAGSEEEAALEESDSRKNILDQMVNSLPLDEDPLPVMKKRPPSGRVRLAPVDAPKSTDTSTVNNPKLSLQLSSRSLAGTSLVNRPPSARSRDRDFSIKTNTSKSEKEKAIKERRRSITKLGDTETTEDAPESSVQDNLPTETVPTESVPMESVPTETCIIDT